MSRRLNILILYVSNQYPMRATLWDQLYCFRHYSNHNCFYLNFSVRRVPWYLRKIKFDLIVFGTMFLATRVVDEWFRDPRERALPLKSFDALKVAFPQDEYLATDALHRHVGSDLPARRVFHRSRFFPRARIGMAKDLRPARPNETETFQRPSGLS